MRARFIKVMGPVALVLAVACPAGAQIEGPLSAYLERNAKGYLQPLVDAFAADVNSGLFHSARIPSNPHLSFELKVMSVFFEDADRTFVASTEGLFTPVQTAEVPTVIGSGTPLTVVAPGGASFEFPGGFDLNTFSIAMPQVRFGAFGGTDALIRFVAFETGQTDLGRIELFGFGVRHSLSQYMGPRFPLHLAGGFFWQSFKMGGDLVNTEAFSIGLQASANMPFLQPYAGVSWDRFSLDLSYQSDALGTLQAIDLAFETETTVHLTLGLALNLSILNVHGEYNAAARDSYSIGVAVGN